MRTPVIVALLTVAFAAAPRHTPAPSPGPATGAVSGVVTDGATNQPIAGAIVVLGSSKAFQTPWPRRQVTDTRGRFVFADLPALDGYNLRVSQPGYDDGYYGAPMVNTSEARIALADGEWFPDANVSMWKLGAISGRVTDEHGDPVVGAYVRVLTPLLIAGTTHLTAGTLVKTDDRGEYRIAGLAPGKYLVLSLSVQNAVPASAAPADIEGLTAEEWAASEARAETGAKVFRRNKGVLDDGESRLILGGYPTPGPAADGTPRAYPIVFYPGALSLNGAATIELGRGENKSAVDLALQPVPTARVSGRVDGLAPPLSGLVVHLVPLGLEDLSIEAATAALAPDGRFTFLNVPAGSYRVDASQALGALGVLWMLPWTPGLTAAGNSAFPIPGLPLEIGAGSFGRSNGYFGSALVSVSGSDVTNVVVEVLRGVTISGRIVREPTAAPPPAQLSSSLWQPTVEPANGDPALIVPRGGGPSGPRPNPAAETFTIQNVRPGEYVLGLTGGFLRPYAMRSLTVNGREPKGDRIDVSDGRDVTDISIMLTDQIPKLSGAIAGHQPSDNAAAVIAFPVDKDLWTRYGFTPIRIRSVGASNLGTFQFTNLPAGEYFVVGVDASQSNAWRDPKFLETALPFATRVTLKWGDTKTLDVKLMPVK